MPRFPRAVGARGSAAVAKFPVEDASLYAGSLEALRTDPGLKAKATDSPMNFGDRHQGGLLLPSGVVSDGSGDGHGAFRCGTPILYTLLRPTARVPWDLFASRNNALGNELAVAMIQTY